MQVRACMHAWVLPTSPLSGLRVSSHLSTDKHTSYQILEKKSKKHTSKHQVRLPRTYITHFQLPCVEDECAVVEPFFYQLSSKHRLGFTQQAVKNRAYPQRGTTRERTSRFAFPRAQPACTSVRRPSGMNGVFCRRSYPLTNLSLCQDCYEKRGSRVTSEPSS